MRRDKNGLKEGDERRRRGKEGKGNCGGGRG